eukprot:6574482-Pyramimonas_sp.AAC.1
MKVFTCGQQLPLMVVSLYGSGMLLRRSRLRSLGGSLLGRNLEPLGGVLVGEPRCRQRLVGLLQL